MTDTSGTLVWRAEHAPFGSIYALTVATISNNLRFPGQYFDSETALAQNWFRDYDAKIGRYWEFDPVNKLLLGYYCGVLKIKLPIFDMNFPYSYAALNPVVMIDFAGLREFSCTYYQKRHKESGCSYYKWAANICEKFRSGEPYGHKITVCIGNCLQDYDKRYCPKKCCAGVFLCNVAAGHQACYSLCFATLGGLP